MIPSLTSHGSNPSLRAAPFFMVVNEMAPISGNPQNVKMTFEQHIMADRYLVTAFTKPSPLHPFSNINAP